jgi:triosephosphate isomerase
MKGVEIVIAPPTAWLMPIIESWKTRHSHISFAAQNVWPEDQGAYTGETSPYMLKNLVKYAIVGHSERRKYQGEDNDLIREKIASCLKWHIKPIFCIGETKKVLNDGKLNETEWEKLVDQLIEGLSGLGKHQLEDIVIAYEPVWAISANNSEKPTIVDYAVEVISRLRAKLADKYGKEAAGVKFLYGGSVESHNVGEYLREDEISGLLVGGASVKAKEFISICQIASATR